MVRSCILFTGEGGLLSSGISGAEAGLVDGHAAEFVLHGDGVAGVRPFRLKQRSSRLLLSARLRQEFLRNILGRALPNDLLLLVQRRD